MPIVSLPYGTVRWHERASSPVSLKDIDDVQNITFNL